MLAGHLVRPRQIELIDVPEPVLPSADDQPGQILFQPELTCLCGSDLPFFDGAFVGNFAPLTAVPAGVIPASGEGVLTLQTPSASQPLCPASGARMGAQAAILSSSLRFSNGASTLF